MTAAIRAAIMTAPNTGGKASSMTLKMMLAESASGNIARPYIPISTGRNTKGSRIIPPQKAERTAVFSSLAEMLRWKDAQETRPYSMDGIAFMTIVSASILKRLQLSAGRTLCIRLKPSPASI